MPMVDARLPVCAGRASYLYGWIAETVRSLLPVIEREGLGVAKEIDVDSLALRLELESIELGCQLMGPIQYGAWVTKNPDASPVVLRATHTFRLARIHAASCPAEGTLRQVSPVALCMGSSDARDHPLNSRSSDAGRTRQVPMSKRPRVVDIPA
jgi:hypothetical protein